MSDAGVEFRGCRGRVSTKTCGEVRPREAQQDFIADMLNEPTLQLVVANPTHIDPANFREYKGAVKWNAAKLHPKKCGERIQYAATDTKYNDTALHGENRQWLATRVAHYTFVRRGKNMRC